MLDVGAVPHSADKNKTETEQKQNANIFYMFRLCFVLSTFSGQMQLSEQIMWRFKENKKKKMMTHAWLLPALCSSHHMYQNKNKKHLLGEASTE